MKKWLVLAGTLVTVGGFGQAHAAAVGTRELSADMVVTPRSGKAVTGHISVGKEKLRTELSTPQGESMVFLNDLKADRSWLLMPKQKTAMAFTGLMAAATGGKPQQSEKLLTDPRGNPCALRQEGRTCTDLGSERVAGRTAEKWRVTEKDGSQTTVWVDKALKLAVRSESRAGTTELTNIREGAQPERLFEIPSDYRVLQTGPMPPRQEPQPGVGGSGPGFKLPKIFPLQPRPGAHPSP